MPDDSVFGDDTNATPLTKLNIPQVTTTKGQPPLEPPVYNATVPQPPPPPPPQQQQEPPMQQREQKHVRFDDVPMMYAPPPPPVYEHHPRHDPRHDLPPPPSSRRMGKMADFMATYAHRILVFVVVCLCLWWYRPVARLPYLGDGEHVSILGVGAMGLLASSMYGIGAYLLDF